MQPGGSSLHPSQKWVCQRWVCFCADRAGCHHIPARTVNHLLVAVRHTVPLAAPYTLFAETSSQEADNRHCMRGWGLALTQVAPWTSTPTWGPATPDGSQSGSGRPDTATGSVCAGKPGAGLAPWARPSHVGSRHSSACAYGTRADHIAQCSLARQLVGEEQTLLSTMTLTMYQVKRWPLQ